ncbi:MAG: hypothetical protein BRD48_06220 [Bacteroidetes bacterium QS_9_68_14]|nr:MAG: hypothetical protein BRD48_06220 [Bacteroidetes bacterium QS_9_68_14]
MGKYVLLLVIGAAGAWSLAQQRTNLQTAEKETEREEEVLARQAARTGLNALLAETRTVAEDMCPDEIPAAVGPMSGTYETGGYNHGTYEAWLEVAPGVDLGYRAHSKGQFPGENGATVTIDRLIQSTENREGLVYGYGGEEGNKKRKLKKTTTEGSEEFGSAPQVKGMGPLATDLDGDGKNEIPHVRQGSAKIEMIDEDAENQEDAQTLVPADASEGVPAPDKTRLSTGTWDGSPKSVFYANKDHDAIYSVSWEDGSATDPQEVMSLGNSYDGAQAVLGIDDIDGDSGEELIFADASQHIRYIDEPGGPVEKLENGGAGSSEGIGTGSLVDLDGDGTVSAVFINGSNNLRVVNADGTDRTIYLDDGSDDGAAKTPPTAVNLDGDDDLEIAYVREEDDDPDVEYVDPDGSRIRSLCGISVDRSVGLVSER